MLIYLHGFRSGPQSEKAQLLRKRMEQCGALSQFWCEQLAWSPAKAVEQIVGVIEKSAEPITLVGSSLGGHFATVLAERYPLAKVVVVNPCITGTVTLSPYLGEQKLIYTDEVFKLTQTHLDELATQEIKHITHPERYWLLVEKGDALLNYQDAVAFYTGARQTVLEGGDHSFTRWSAYLDEILQFSEHV